MCLSSVQFNLSVVSDSLQPRGLQHARPPCPSPSPGAYSNSCPSSQWCHPTIPSSVIPFSSHLQSFLASGAFPMSQLFASGGQSVGVSASASAHQVGISLFNEHPGLISFRIDWFGLLAVQRTLKGLLQHHSSKTSILQHSAFCFLLAAYFIFKTIEMMLDKNQIQTIFLLKFKMGHRPAGNSQHQPCIWPRNC